MEPRKEAGELVALIERIVAERNARRAAARPLPPATLTRSVIRFR